MNTNWVISIIDLHAKDRAFKCVNKSREEASIKANSLLQKYENAFEKDRFRIEVSELNAEIDIKTRVKVSGQGNLGELFTELHELDPFMFKEEGNQFLFEINKTDNLPEMFSYLA